MCANSKGCGETAQASMSLRGSPLCISTIISRAGSFKEFTLQNFEETQMLCKVYYHIPDALIQLVKLYCTARCAFCLILYTVSLAFALKVSEENH